MIFFIIKKLIALLFTLIIIAILLFLLIHCLLPGDPVRIMAGIETDDIVILAIRHELKLDQSIIKQLWRFITYMITGDFGISMVSKQPVIEEISSRFMPTLWLTIITIGWSLLFGIFVGIIAAIWHNRWPDKISMILIISGISLPTFVLAILLIQIFSVYLGWCPILGATSPRHYILPSITLGVSITSIIARFTRISFIEVMQENYICTARSKGVKEIIIIMKHGLRNAMIPVVTITGLQLGFLLGGSIVVESIFNWPGLGKLLMESIVSRDYPIIQAEVLLFSLEFMLINLLLDIINVLINPAIKYH